MLEPGDPMKKDTHNFIHTYQGLGAFGMNRETDEQTIMFYLQKFSEDTFMQTIVPRLSDEELEKIYQCIHEILKQHISEDEYHELFLKDR
jgi:TorA maturation chaperone TorD